MKDYLTVGNAITFVFLLYIAINLFFMYLQHLETNRRRDGIDRAVQSLAKAVEAQEVTVEKLEQLVVKVTLERRN